MLLKFLLKNFDCENRNRLDKNKKTHKSKSTFVRNEILNPDAQDIRLLPWFM